MQQQDEGSLAFCMIFSPSLLPGGAGWDLFSCYVFEMIMGYQLKGLVFQGPKGHQFGGIWIVFFIG